MILHEKIAIFCNFFHEKSSSSSFWLACSWWHMEQNVTEHGKKWHFLSWCDILKHDILSSIQEISSSMVVLLRFVVRVRPTCHVTVKNGVPAKKLHTYNNDTPIPPWDHGPNPGYQESLGGTSVNQWGLGKVIVPFWAKTPIFLYESFSHFFRFFQFWWGSVRFLTSIFKLTILSSKKGFWTY